MSSDRDEDCNSTIALMMLRLTSYTGNVKGLAFKWVCRSFRPGPCDNRKLLGKPLMNCSPTGPSSAKLTL